MWFDLFFQAGAMVRDVSVLLTFASYSVFLMKSLFHLIQHLSTIFDLDHNTKKSRYLKFEVRSSLFIAHILEIVQFLLLQWLLDAFWWLHRSGPQILVNALIQSDCYTANIWQVSHLFKAPPPECGSNPSAAAPASACCPCRLLAGVLAQPGTFKPMAVATDGSPFSRFSVVTEVLVAWQDRGSNCHTGRGLALFVHPKKVQG